MYRLILTIQFLCLTISQGYTQQKPRETTASSGKSTIVYTPSTTYAIVESIGQASVAGTFNYNNYDLRQGFLQPVSISALYEGFDESIDAKAYPNPFTSQVTIAFNEPVVGPLDVALYDTNGKLIFKNTLDAAPKLVLSFDFLASGSYFLRIKSQGRLFTANLIKR